MSCAYGRYLRAGNRFFPILREVEIRGCSRTSGEPGELQKRKERFKIE
jgi:hypothetical protein